MIAAIEPRLQLLPVSSAKHQDAWERDIYDVYCRQGLGEFLPERWHLEPHHQADLAKSGISAIDAASAGICSVGPVYLERLGIPVGRSAEPLLVFFYLDPWGTPYTWESSEGDRIPFCRAKLNRPQGSQKYTQPGGSGIFPYFPQLAPGRVKGWSSWGHAAQLDEQEHSFSPYPTTDAEITEGEKKALKATLERFPCIGLGGVWNFKGEWGGVHSDLGLICDRMRSLTLIYDNDCSAKPQVVQAANALIKGLVEGEFSKEQREEEAHNKLRSIRNGVAPAKAEKGAIADRLFWTLLPQTLAGDKIGLDDLLVQPRGAELLRKLIENRLPGVVTIEEGKDKEGNPKRVSVHPAYLAEPLGDIWLVKHLPKNRQEHLRRVLTEAGMVLSNIIPIQGNYPYKWDTASRIWRFMSKEEWESLPLQIADRHQWVNRQGGLIATCAAELLKHAQPAEEMNPSNLVGFLNGDYNPVTGELLPILPEHRLTSRINVPWVPEASCSGFMDALHSWLTRNDSTEQIDLLRAALRWTLHPKQCDRKFGTEIIVGIQGPAGRGKGTLLDILSNLFGPNACADISLPSIAEPNILKSCMGKQVILDRDVKGFISDRGVGVMNKIASNEPVEVLIKYKDSFSAQLGMVLWFAANRPLKTSNQAEDIDGLHRRLIMIYFDNKPAKKDPHMGDKILRELPGIVQWAWSMPIEEALSTLENYQNRGMDADQIEDALELHPIYMWLLDLLGRNAGRAPGDDAELIVANTNTLDPLTGRPHERVQMPTQDECLRFTTWLELYTDYRCWSERIRDRTPYGMENFSMFLKNVGVTAKKNDGRRYKLLPLSIDKLNVDALITGT